MKKKGFTLIDLLIFIAIFTVAAAAFVTVFISITNIQIHQQSQTTVSQEGQFVLQQIQYYVENARIIDMPLNGATGTLTLEEASLGLSPTIISVSSGTVYLQQGGGTPQALTTNHVVVSSMFFSRNFSIAPSTAFGVDSVSFSFTVAENTSNTKLMYSQSYRSAASVLAPVPQIALVQRAKNGNASGGTTIGLAYENNNEAGNLLIAVTATASSSGAASITDSEGNAWTNVASATSHTFAAELNVFAAVNVAGGLNNVTATFAGDIGANASLFIYEYRGAATSSSFDATANQWQPGTQTPSSGLVSPTSTVELLFGVDQNGLTPEIPSAGNGFNLEATSTYSNTYIEDADQFITGSVAATWQYANTTPNSEALIATFR